MSSIPNLNTLRTGRGRPRLRRGGRGVSSNNDGSSTVDEGASRDKIIQQTDHDASSSRMSAIELGYLQDDFAKLFWPASETVPKRYPIINRGTYVRSHAIDKLVKCFLESEPKRKKQIISLGAGSDTRFFRFQKNGAFRGIDVEYHELDFEANVNNKRQVIRNSTRLSDEIRYGEMDDAFYRLHAIDLRDLTTKSPPAIPDLDSELPTLILSECCLCYLPPETTNSVIQYFTMNIKAPMGLVIYEPIRPFDAFGKTMVSNLASRGIQLQTLKRFASLEAQRQRLRIDGFDSGQGARDIYELWQSDVWVGGDERQMIESLEWLDEIEEWQLLASHYCLAWGWRGEEFGQAWADLEGGRSSTESKLDDVD
jgi:[phosphatase 2A protein]-leucine-carboxy methyltransferase